MERLSSLLGKECYDVMIVKNNMFDSHCLQQVIAQLLGFAIILGSVLYKLPQILKLQASKSAEGMSLSLYILELVVYVTVLIFSPYMTRRCSITTGASVAHGAPFSTYGESVFIALQNVVIVMQLVTYSKALNATFVFGSLVYVAWVVALHSGVVPLDLWDKLQMFNILVSIVSRVPQIVSNFSTRNVSNQSIITWGLNFVGGIARCFTTIKMRPNEFFLLLGYVIACFLNGTITFQILLFGGKSAKNAARPTKKGSKGSKRE